ncbi:MAG: class I SAM-dependent methyltransferase [Solirubrobacterales bacterium]
MSRPAASHVGPQEWDAEVYHRVSRPQFEWASEVLERLPLAGDELVLDAGCGTGRVTALLVQRLPRGKVIGIDASESMVERARETLGDRAEVRAGSLTELELDEPVDAVFSNAVFHWIPDHDLLFRRLHDALRPRGRLVAQCGGEGNVAAVTRAIREVAARAPFAEHLADMESIWNFSSPAVAEHRLRAAGFERVECWLEQKHVVPDEPLEYLATSALGPQLARLPDAQVRPFVDAVAARMPSPLSFEYVRLNINARRPE